MAILPRLSMRNMQAALALCLTWLPGPLLAETAALDAVLARATAPAGIVFEIVDRDPQALNHALPWVVDAARQLRQRFPKLEMAVVSHGQEMFALQKSAQGKNLQPHQLAQQLVKQEGIPVHVCETYAGWKGIAPEAFPEYIDVAPAGPAQINNYMALGYIRIVVPKTAKR
ncbi:MAG: DsrE family protein [Hydrogenophilaceae bacterium]|nr:DsrE family protein [Hydrogenophilaceae bacterium]